MGISRDSYTASGEALWQLVLMNSLFSIQRQPLGGREASRQRASNEKCPNTRLIRSTVLKMAHQLTVRWLCAFLSKWELTVGSFFFAVTLKRGHCWENFETWRMIWVSKYWETLAICCTVEVVAWQNFMPHLLMVVRSLEIPIPTLVLAWHFSFSFSSTSSRFHTHLFIYMSVQTPLHSHLPSSHRCALQRRHVTQWCWHQQAERHLFLLTTDPITHHGGEEAEHSLELYYSSKWKYCSLLHESCF